MSKKEIKKYEENKQELEKILKVDKTCRTFAFILVVLESVSILCLIQILIFNNKNHELIYFLILNILIGLMVLSIVSLEISKCKRKKERLVENLNETEELLAVVPIVDDETEPEEIEEPRIDEQKTLVVPVVMENKISEEDNENNEEKNIIVPVVTEEEVSKEQEIVEEKNIPIALPLTEFDDDEDNYDDLEEIHVVHEVNVEEANELMTDVEAVHFIHEKENFISDRTNRGIVNVKQLSRYFVDEEIVTLEGMKVRIPGFDKKLTYVKVLADGILDKPLKVYADDFSIEAAKMILLTGGRVVRAKK